MIYAHTYSRILLSHKKEWNLTFCNYIAGFRGYYPSKISQTEKDKYSMISLKNGIQKTKQMNKYNKTETDS